MKRLITIILTLSLILSMGICISAQAAGEAFTFALLANGETSAAVEVGGEITVTLKVSDNSGAENFDLYSMQDYVCFDPDYLEYVADSIEVYTIDGTLTKVVTADAIKFNSTTSYDEVFVNRGSLSSVSVESGAVLLTFKLKALQTGSVTLTNARMELSRSTGSLYTVASQTANVVIGSTPTPPSGGGGVPGGSGGGDTNACDGGDDCPAKHFSDIDTGAWYHEAVDYVILRGLMNGMDADTFGTNQPTLRGQIVTILYRLEGEPEVTGGNIFKDVEDAAYYKDAIIWATENNIANGYGDGSFGPMDSITREQLAAILWRYANYKGYDLSAMAGLSGFVDEDDIHTWATDAMSWANANELITGLPGSILAPQNNAVRVQVAAILMRFCENMAK